MTKARAHKILIVEDEVPTALALGDKLAHEGYNVLKADNGKKGLEVALNEHPDLILADLKMPEMGGLEMIAALRTDDWGKDAKIIILTNVSDVASVDEAMRRNTFNYIVKGDTTMESVLEKVRAQFGETK